MKIIKSAQSGSFESSDIMILVEPVKEQSGRIIELESTVSYHYGDEIQRVIIMVLDNFKVTDIRLIAKDKGALNPTIEARVETALKRAAGIEKVSF